MKRIAASLVTLILTLGSSYAAVLLPYGTRAGMSVTIVELKGIDTEAATIRVEHTRANAKAFCVEYVQTTDEQCVETTLREVRLNDVIKANCKTGLFTNLGGASLRFAGASPSGEEPKYRIFRSGSVEPLDASMASGYNVNLDQFTALCPETVIRAGERPQTAAKDSASTSRDDLTRSWEIRADGIFDNSAQKYVLSVRDIKNAASMLGNSFQIQSRVTKTHGRGEPLELEYAFLRDGKRYFIATLDTIDQRAVAFPLTVVSPDLVDRAGVRVGVTLSAVAGYNWRKHCRFVEAMLECSSPYSKRVIYDLGGKAIDTGGRLQTLLAKNPVVGIRILAQ
jgi:hypothetical protein